MRLYTDFDSLILLVVAMIEGIDHSSPRQAELGLRGWAIDSRVLELQDWMSMVLRPIEMVGGNDDELFLFVCQVGEELKHLLGGLEIEEIGGFVEEHDGRVLCHSARQHHALSLTIGEGVHGARCQMGNAATMQHTVHKSGFVPL